VISFEGFTLTFYGKLGKPKVPTIILVDGGGGGGLPTSCKFGDPFSRRSPVFGELLSRRSVEKTR